MAGTRTGVHTLVEVEDGSRTQTIHMHLTPEDNEQEENQEGEPRRVQWAADVIDNEHLNKKSSKSTFTHTTHTHIHTHTHSHTVSPSPPPLPSHAHW